MAAERRKRKIMERRSLYGDVINRDVAARSSHVNHVLCGKPELYIAVTYMRLLAYKREIPFSSDTLFFLPSLRAREDLFLQLNILFRRIRIPYKSVRADQPKIIHNVSLRERR